MARVDQIGFLSGSNAQQRQHLEQFVTDIPNPKHRPTTMLDVTAPSSIPSLLEALAVASPCEPCSPVLCVIRELDRS